MVSTEIKPGRNYLDDFFLVHRKDSEQDHLWNLIISEVYPKGQPKSAHVSKHNFLQPKIWSMIFFFFFWFWLSEELSTERILSQKMWGYGFNFWRKKKKRKLFKQNLTKKQCIYSMLVAKNHQKFRSGFWVHEFSFADDF